jgi:hypothetical protein
MLSMVLVYLVFKEDPFAVKGGPNPGLRQSSSTAWRSLQ